MSLSSKEPRDHTVGVFTSALKAGEAVATPFDYAYVLWKVETWCHVERERKGIEWAKGEAAEQAANLAGRSVIGGDDE